MIEYPKQEDLNSSNCTERSIKIHYPEFYKYIIENSHCENWNENLYWFYNKLNEYPKCKTCGNRTKFISLKDISFAILSFLELVLVIPSADT